MASECAELLLMYYAGKYARSVLLPLEGSTLRGAHDRLLAAGFEHERRPLLAFRSREGAPLWQTREGLTSADASDPSLVRVNYYLHADGGMVRIFAQGEPRGRLAPARVPSALKSVVFRRSGTAVSALTTSTAFNNEAFRVTSRGMPLPKSRREMYGVRFERDEAVASFWSADSVHDAAIIPLSADPVPDALFR